MTITLLFLLHKILFPPPPWCIGRNRHNLANISSDMIINELPLHPRRVVYRLCALMFCFILRYVVLRWIVFPYNVTINYQKMFNAFACRLYVPLHLWYSDGNTHPRNTWCSTQPPSVCVRIDQGKCCGSIVCCHGNGDWRVELIYFQDCVKCV